MPAEIGALDFFCLIGNNFDMTAEQVKKAREKAPFKPFTIYLSDQRRVEIPHADFVWVMPGGRTIGIADENGAAEIVDLVHVTSLKLKEGDEG